MAKPAGEEGARVEDRASPAIEAEPGYAPGAHLPRGRLARRVGGRLFRKYVILFVAVVSAALLASGALQIWFVYEGQTRSLALFQQEQARMAARLAVGMRASTKGRRTTKTSNQTP